MQREGNEIYPSCKNKKPKISVTQGIIKSFIAANSIQLILFSFKKTLKAIIFLLRL